MTNPNMIQEPPLDPQDTPQTGSFRRVALENQPNNQQNYAIQEPPLTLEDTHPRQIVSSPRGTSFASIILYGLALVITIAAAAVYLGQGSGADTPSQIAQGQPTASNAIDNPSATENASDTVLIEATPIPPTLEPTAQPAPIVASDVVVPVDVIAELLLKSGKDTAPEDVLYRQQNAFTIAPVRPRIGVIDYKIQLGDTLDKIATKFGISTDTLVWNNDGIYVNRLFPGDTLTILPESGVRHKTVGEETIQSIADKYKVSPYAIIDSEYNRLQNANPSTTLPIDTSVIVPGGVSDKKAIFWDPGIIVSKNNKTATTGSGVSAGANVISFGGGQSGSCGNQPNSGGSGTFILPLAAGSYIITRGFSAAHSGMDMATSAGHTVFAADGGTVIFAGWSSFGYGNAIVLAHGNFLTLYGHLSAISVRCGQSVSQGQPIGAVGSTGQSSGPHLHFEIRPATSNFYPDNPANYMGF